MKQLTLAAGAILGLAAPSTAADLRLIPKAPAPVATLAWSGWYVGAHAGYGWGRKNWVQTFSNQDFPLDRTTSGLSLDAILVGGQAGWNYRSAAWVLGFEGDWSWTNASDCKLLVIFTDYANCTRAKWYATATARAGHVWNNVLVFAKGGLALVREEHFATAFGIVDTQTTRNLRTGWVVGAGLEHAFAANWTWKVEYNHLGFGTRSIRLDYLPEGTSPGLAEHWDVAQRVHAVKAGINYHFTAHR